MVKTVPAVNALPMPCTRTSCTRACGVAPPRRWLAALRVALPNTVTRMARPREPPSCYTTFTRLAAAPVSRGSTPERATRVSATNGKPMPMPNSSIGPRTPEA